MIKEIAHIGVTIKDMDTSIKFYRDVLGLKFEGELIMEGKETDALFNRKNVKVRVAYLNGSDHIMTPPVELLQFVNENIKEDSADLFKTLISEICFMTDDIVTEYERLKKAGVEFLSEPQYYDFTEYGFGKSKAVYFKDPDGIILELMEAIK